MCRPTDRRRNKTAESCYYGVFTFSNCFGGNFITFAERTKKVYELARSGGKGFGRQDGIFEVGL